MVKKQLLTAGIAAIIAIAAQAQTGRISIDGELMPLARANAAIVNDRVMIPLRAVSEQLGASVQWHTGNHVVIIDKRNVRTKLQLGNPNAEINQQAVLLDVPPMLLNGRMMVPLRFVSESLGAAVRWDRGTRTAIVVTLTGVAESTGSPLPE